MRVSRIDVDRLSVALQALADEFAWSWAKARGEQDRVNFARYVERERAIRNLAEQSAIFSSASQTTVIAIRPAGSPLRPTSPRPAPRCTSDAVRVTLGPYPVWGGLLRATALIGEGLGRNRPVVEHDLPIGQVANLEALIPIATVIEQYLHDVGLVPKAASRPRHLLGAAGRHLTQGNLAQVSGWRREVNLPDAGIVRVLESLLRG